MASRTAHQCGLVGLSLGAAVLLVLAEKIWLVVWLLTRQPSTHDNKFVFGIEAFSIIALAGIFTVGPLIGLSLVSSIIG